MLYKSITQIYQTNYTICKQLYIIYMPYVCLYTNELSPKEISYELTSHRIEYKLQDRAKIKKSPIKLDFGAY